MLEQSELVKTLIAANRSSQFAQDWSGRSPGPIKGKIIDVDDPEERGRVKVIFDSMSSEVKNQPQAQNYNSHWIDVSPSFKGKQSKKLLNARVLIAPVEGNYGQSVIQDIIYDADTQSVASEEMPQSSTATRLPIYPSGSLPPAEKENHGMMVVEEDGPLDSDWLCVCLKRNGNYYWVRHIDLNHGHAGQDSGLQGSDSDGDGEQPVDEQTVWDYVFPSTDQESTKSSIGGISPRPNPKGDKAIWYGGAS